MPLTFEQKKQKLLALGLDPNEYTWEDGEDTLVEEAPVPVTPPEMGALEAFKTRLKRSAIPGLASLPAMGGGFKAGMTLGAPFGPVGAGIGGGLGAIGAGIGANLLTSKIQEKALEALQSPEAYQAGLAKMAQAEKDQKIASFAGDLLPNIAGFKPSLNAARGIGNLIQGVRPDRLAREGMILAPVNAGVSGGVDLAQQAAMNPPEVPIDYGRVGLNALAGGVFNEPNRLGRKFFPAPVSKENPPDVSSAPEIDPGYIKPRPTEIVDEHLADTNFARPAEPVPGDKKVETDPQYTYPIKGIDETLVATRPKSTERAALNKELDDTVTGDDLKPEEYNEDPGAKFYQAAEQGTKLTPEQLTKAQDYAAKRGVKLKQEPTIQQPSGEPARGYSIPSKRVAAVSDIASSDTPYHEIGGHQFPADLERSLSPKDRKLFDRLKSINDGEARAEFIGKRVVEIESKPVRAWVEDALANVKRVTGLASDEDILKHTARRARDDRPYAESPELWSSGEDGAGPRYFSGPGKPGEINEEVTTKASFGAPLVDRLKTSSPKAGKAAEEFEVLFRQNQGKYVNKGDAIARDFKEPAKVLQWMYETRMTGSSGVKLLPEDLSKVNAGSGLRKLLVQVHEDQRAKGIKVAGREARDNPNYFPLLTDLKVINTIKRGGPEAASLKKDFVDFQLKFNPKEAPTPEAAKEILNDYLRGISTNPRVGTPEYQAIRKAQGIGLPFSWVEKNPSKLLHRYFNNVSQDFAYFDSVQSKPEIRALFNAEDQFGNKPNTKGIEPVADTDALDLAKKRMVGDHTQTEVIFNSVEHMVRGFILGTATGIRNHVSAYVQMLPYVEARDMPKIIEAFQYLSKGFADSMDAGVNRWNITDLESARLGVGYYADKLKSLGDLARKYQGATAIEQWTRAHNMMVGELITQAMWGRAAKGEIKAKAWLRKFGTEVDPATTPISREILLETSAQFVERVQGTYGMRGLPAGLLEPTSPAYWMLSLSKWGIEKANVVKADVIQPAMKGDFGPLIRYATGGALGGAAIVSINEVLNNKKAATPNMKELQEEGSADDYAYKAFEIASLAGLGGILSDAAKASMDLYFKNQPKSPGIPSVNFVAEDIVGGLSDVMEAVNEGSPTIPTLLAWLRDTVVNNVQAIKLGVTQVKGKENERKDKFRDKRVYDQLTERPVTKQGQDYNPYLKSEEKEFKKANNFEEAKEVLEEKIKPKLEAMEPEERKRAIAGLKRNSYQTFPSDRREARAYFDYLSRTQGGSSALLREEDKRAQDLLNRRKSRLVPRQ
jgi:hypothetical protein